jgi:NTE family protein
MQWMTNMRPFQSPRFTLVLGSGGVKSIAGLGAMEVFEAEGLRPTAVAGCSAGAIFGALIAAGHPARDGIEMARQLWSRDITSRKRHRAWLEVVLPRTAGFDDRFALRDDGLILKRLQAAFGNTPIEDLPLPLRIQATCAATGAPVVLHRGSLVQALRASVALPFLFAPHRVEGRLLVDGSLSDPLPVDAAPPGLVSVALGFRVPFPRIANSATRLATRVTAALSNNLLNARLAAADPARLVLMLPELPRRVGLFETEAMPELIELGRQAARAALPRLHLLLGNAVRLAAMA